MTIARGARVLTSDGVEIGHVDRLMQRRGSPPCLYLSLERAARSEPTPVIVTAADVTVEDGQVRLRHVAHRDLDVTSWARGGGLHTDERPPSRLEGERPAIPGCQSAAAEVRRA